MIRSIAVPLDGSGAAECAVPVAARLARAAGATLRLVLVHDPGAGIVARSAADDHELQFRERTYLAETALGLGQVGPEPIGQTLLAGSPGAALVEWLDREPPELVVMSTHGRGRASRSWLGSVSDYLIRHAKQPLLLLRSDPPSSQLPELKAGVVALDLSEESGAILERLADLAALTRARVKLVHVVEMDRLGPGHRVHARSVVERLLDRAARHLRSNAIPVSTEILVGSGVVATLIAYLGRAAYDCLALTTHGAGGFRQHLIGSVADKLIRSASGPVLVVRPDRKRTNEVGKAAM